jgi:hypothetical protein
VLTGTTLREVDLALRGVVHFWHEPDGADQISMPEATPPMTALANPNQEFSLMGNHLSTAPATCGHPSFGAYEPNHGFSGRLFWHRTNHR